LKVKLEEEEATTEKLKSELTSKLDQASVLQATVESLQKQLDQARQELANYKSLELSFKQTQQEVLFRESDVKRC
jgi:capsule polysaccharide export protein KpsE/RkpR